MPESDEAASCSSLELRAGHDVQRLRRRDRLDHVAVEVADLDDDAVRLVVRREVQLAVVLVQLLARRSAARSTIVARLRRSGPGGTSPTIVS